jgi:competence/damage-inducible protein CinA-like protein
MPSVEIVAIGSELLLGQIADSNSAWMAQRFTNLGVDLFYKTVVGDNPRRMHEVINRALERSDIVITSGGLGPTQDDLTREVVAEVTARKLTFDPRLMEEIEELFRKRGRSMTPNNQRQAYIPQGAIPVRNPNGTAPSFIVEDPRGVIFSLPGVPVELKWLFENEVEPYLRRKFRLNEVITYRVLKIIGMGESAVDDRVGHLIANCSNPTVGVLAHPGQVDVRITAKASDKEAALRLIGPIEAQVRRLLGCTVFATDDETMEAVVGRLLREKGKTIAIYEDVTCGQLAERLHQASSEHFVVGLISNGAPSIRRLLAGSRHADRLDDLLRDPVALTEELAWFARKQAGSDLGLALHALPDPNRQLENMSGGQTYISISDGNRFVSQATNIAGRAISDRGRMTLAAIDLLRTVLLQT